MTDAGVRRRIAVLDDYQGQALSLADWSSLAPYADVTAFRDTLADEDRLVERLAGFDVVVAMRERTPFPASLLARLPRLRLLVSTGTSNASIDLAACERLGIATAAAVGRGGLAATAEMTWALILALAKRLPASERALRDGRWQPDFTDALDGRVLGLVGLGRIGTRVARAGLAFGMKVQAWSANLTEARAREAGVVAVDKATLFRTSDVVSLHLVLSPTTMHVVGAAELAAMPSHALLVNTSRAPLVDQAALLDALRQRRIGGAGLDVFDHEPLSPDHPVCRLDNVVLTPHLGYVTRENMAAFHAAAVAQILAWHDGRDFLRLQP